MVWPRGAPMPLVAYGGDVLFGPAIRTSPNDAGPSTVGILDSLGSVLVKRSAS